MEMDKSITPVLLFFNLEFLAATMEKSLYMKEEKLY